MVEEHPIEIRTAHIITASRRGEGGWVATPNIDICRLTRRDLALRSLVAGASLIVPDGAPLVWASRLRGHPLPERVAGGSLIFSLSEAAVARGTNGHFEWKVLELYNDVTRKVSADTGVRLVDLAREVPKDSRYFSDWIHYTNEGAVLIGDLVFRRLEPRLR